MDIGEDILLEDAYEININAYNLRDFAIEFEKEKKRKKEAEEAGRDYEEEYWEVKRYINNVAWLPRIAIDCIYNFFVSIKKEMEMTGFKIDSIIISGDSISSRVFSVLQKFSLEFQKGKDLEEVLLDYIEDLREFNFYPPVEYIEEEILELRSHKIEFFKKVLEEYRKDKERYDKSLEISVEARNSLNLEVKKIDAHKKKKIERQILQEEKDSRILLEDTYEINIGAFNLKDFEGELDYKEAKEILGVKRYYRNNVALIPKIAIDCIHNFFILIKDEMEMVEYEFDTINNNELMSLSTKVLIFLQKLRSNIQKGKDLEEIIFDNIEHLKEFNLHSQIKSLEDQLLKLRSYKIEFFKKVLEEYRKDKERYDKSLRTSVEARKANSTRYKFKKN